MFTFETTDHRNARRFRIAQFNGRLATVQTPASTITGHVRAVQECKSSEPLRWSITIVPNPPGVKDPTGRGVLVVHRLAEKRA